MIDFYTWKIPDGQKIAIMLEEVGLPYRVCPVDLTKQEQYDPAFLKINPNNKIPVIVDHGESHHHTIRVFESGAILIYLAEKTGKLLPIDVRKRVETMEWLMFQMSGMGPMAWQLHHFLYYAAEKIPYAVEYYTNEVRRLYRVMDGHLEKELYFAGEYSIADIAIFPWVHLHERHRIDFDDYPNLARWHRTIAEREAVMKGLALI